MNNEMLQKIEKNAASLMTSEQTRKFVDACLDSLRQGPLRFETMLRGAVMYSGINVFKYPQYVCFILEMFQDDQTGKLFYLESKESAENPSWGLVGMKGYPTDQEDRLAVFENWVFRNSDPFSADGE